ncbi:hypothetical protein BDA99DRAFT_563151 [Phascolomyces articulosus]|uniref:Uncharacterized protein n=1 Tax=Phascolomyces articulosus TaxID=60185 RepID=A0AAD5K2F0_9FUNG|nr:hypothetical protein BDA99DRAFT_563151 [Phascolomyces articulosus]
MYSPAANRLRDATASVRTRSPLGTPPLSATEPPSSTQKASSASTTTTVGEAAGSSTTASSSDQLGNIFNAVRQQIQKWGENAKWKIDLVLLDNSQQNRQDSPSLRPPPQQSQNLRVTTTVGHQGYMLPVSNSTQYPMDYTAPTSVPADMYTEELRQQLHDSLERQRYLENIVRTQADQIHYSQAFPPEANKAIETMRSIYMMSENEQKLRYLMDTKVLHKDMEALSRKLRRVTSTLQGIETMELPPHESQLSLDTLLEERKLLKRKLHLSELRLSARDAELEYLHQLLKSSSSEQPQQHPQAPSFYPHYETTPSIQSPKPQHQQQQHSQQQQQQQAPFGSSPKRGPPYLFQQQYSPKMRHDIRPPSMQQTTNNSNTEGTASPQLGQQQEQQLSALESLGIVADRMLNDPGFTAPQEKKKETTETKTATRRKKKNDSPNLDSINRSKRSIDSANVLLSMPTTLMFPTRHDEKKDVTLTEGNAQNMEQEQPSKKARIETSSWEKNNSPSTPSSSTTNKQEPDARQSPSIAALLDKPSPTTSSSIATTNKQQSQPPQHFSPHATPPLAPTYESDPHQPHSHQPPTIVPEQNLPPPAPGYRPPSPASTPKGRRHSAQEFNRNNDNNDNSTTH